VVMIRHIDLGNTKEERRRNLASLIRKGLVSLGGYRKGKIYGLLNCPSGKRMKTENRVFFKDEWTALANGYRPCGHCLAQKYKAWKNMHKVTR